MNNKIKSAERRESEIRQANMYDLLFYIFLFVDVDARLSTPDA
jgi:hypothetical protein